MNKKSEARDYPVILMVTNNYTPYSGGVVSSIQVTAAALRTSGYHVIIATLDFTASGSDEADVVRIPSCARFRWRQNYMAIPWRPYHALEALIARYKPDVIHVHHPFLLGNYAQKIAKKHRIPVVFTFHTLYEKYLHYLPLPQVLVKNLTHYSVKKFCKKVDVIISPSTSISYYIAQNFGCASQTIASAILPEFRVAAPPSKTIRSTPLELVSVSRFTPEKNVRFLLTMFAKLDAAYRLTLIGYGSEQDALQNYAYQSLGLSPERVRFIIKPEKKVIAQWYKKAHIFVFASTTETQGLVLNEAMAAGTPVVALRGPGVVDALVDGKNGYIVDSVGEMVQRIEQMVADDVLYQQLRAQAHASAQEYYPEVLIKKLCAVYDELMHLRA